MRLHPAESNLLHLWSPPWRSWSIICPALLQLLSSGEPLWTRGDSFFCCTHLFPVSICVIAPHSPYPVPRGLIFERSSLLFKKTNKTCAFVSLCLRLVDRPGVETVGESLRKPIIFNYSFIFIHSRVRRADAGTLGEDVVTPGHH